MKQRVISGAVLVVILAITLYFGGIVTCGLMALVSLVGNMELLRVYGVNKKTPGIVCYLATVLYYIAIYLDRMDIIVPMMVIYLLVMLAVYVLTFPTYSDKQIMAAFMDFFYVSVMLSFVYLIRNMEHGLVLVLLIFVSSWINDTCAYFVGRALGKHKMAPVLSPKKSIEGLIGGIVGAGVFGAVFGILFDKYVPAEADGAGLFARLARVQQGRAVGHLDDVRGVAGRRHIEDGEAGVTVLQSVQHCGDEIARVQRPRLARLQIDLYAVLLLHPGDAGFQRGKVIARAGDVVSAAEIEPFQPRQQVAEFLFHGVQRHGQSVITCPTTYNYRCFYY